MMRRLRAGGRALRDFAGRELGVAGTLLLAMLLLADGAFIAVEVVSSIFDLRPARVWELGYDRGHPEVLQWIKEAWVAGLLGLLATIRRSWLLATWSALFAYFLLDDSLLLHEKVGGRLARELSLGGGLGLRGQDLGELLFVGAVGGIFTIALVLVHRRGAEPERTWSRQLMVIVGALVVFGVVLDQLDIAAGGTLGRLLEVAEDGGEMVAMSVAVATAFGWLSQHGRA